MKLCFGHDQNLNENISTLSVISRIGLIGRNSIGHSELPATRISLAGTYVMRLGDLTHLLDKKETRFMETGLEHEPRHLRWCRVNPREENPRSLPRQG